MAKREPPAEPDRVIHDPQTGEVRLDYNPPQANGATEPKANGADNPKSNGKGKTPPPPKIISGADLARLKFDPIDYIIPGYIAPGMTLLAGKPKIGKSWLVLDWALAVAWGGVAMGTVEVEQGGVLYLGLEDNQRRLQARLKQLAGDRSIPDCIHFGTEWPRVDNHGADIIRAELKRIKKPRLVVVDVIGKLRPRVHAKDIYAADYAAIEPLKRLVDERTDLAIVACHHVSKRIDAADPFDLVSGSTGLTGAADTVAILSRDSNGMRLYGRGRDIEEFDTAVNFDATRGSFSALGSSADVFRSDQRNAILKILAETPYALSPKEIAAVGGLRDDNVRKLLGKMVAAGEVEKTTRGQYRLCDRSSDRTSHNGRWNGYQ